MTHAAIARAVFELINRADPRADFARQRYDIARLALRLLDFVVINQASLGDRSAPASVVDHLTQLALDGPGRMGEGARRRPRCRLRVDQQVHVDIGEAAEIVVFQVLAEACTGEGN